MTHWLALLAVVLLAPHARADALTLDDVLDAVATHHPLIAAELAAVQAAQAEAFAARGEFDTKLSAQGRIAPAGYYDPKRADVVLEQATPFLGASVYAGYRIGVGNIAPYYGEQVTLDKGEVRGGVRVPVLQGRGIDERRAGLRTTDLNVRASEAGRDKVALDLERSAASAYFAWVAAGLKMQVAEELLQLAEKRNEQVNEQVALGALPSLESLDNQRTILQRSSQQIAMRRAFEKASIELSLFLRDPEGAPRIAPESELPSSLDPPDAPPYARLEAERRALELRPEISQQLLALQVTGIERELGANQLLPRLDVFGEVSRDFGDGRQDIYYTRRPTIVELGLSLSVPLWQRKARGKLRAIDAKLRANEQKLEFTRDRARADVQDAYSQLDAARERSDVAEQAFETALRVADAERERFQLGASTVLFVNLREQAAADAQMSAIDAQAELGFARTRVTLATGTSLRTLPRE